MKKAFVIGSLLVVLTLSLGGSVASKGTDSGATYEQLRLFTEVLSIVQNQYVDEVLCVRDEPAHGPAFKRVCEERGIDARAAGAPQVPQDAAQNPVLERIAKLLALAESPNEHEAQAAMSAAQRLMLKHNIEAAVSGSTTSYCFRHLGKPTGRVSEHERRLAMLLDEFFFVQVIWVPVWRVTEAKRGSVLEVCGSRDNVELAAYVYDFLIYTSDALYRADRYEYRTSLTHQTVGSRSTWQPVS